MSTVRLKATVTLTFEYDADPTSYVGIGREPTPVEMASMDEDLMVADSRAFLWDHINADDAELDQVNIGLA